MVTQEQIRYLIDYDPDTGVFTWKQARRGVRVGAECGRKSVHGYREIGLAGTLYRAHRLAFLYMSGEMPAHSVDHINGVKDDNRWSNLRLATQSQNMANVSLQADNTSGVHGVTWDSSRGKWRAQICVAGKKRNLGRFDSKDAAGAAYRKAAQKEWGEFCRA